MKSQANSIAEFAIDHGIFNVLDEPITLKSGKKSRIYINWRTALEDVYLSDKLSDILISELTKFDDIDMVMGVAEGATKLALLSQYKMAKANADYKKGSNSFSAIRGKVKEHGSLKDKYFLGFPKGNIALIEDVTTTGGSLMDAVKILKEVDGVELKYIFVLTNRDESVKKLISEEYGIPFIPLSTSDELANEYFEKNKCSEEFQQLVREELNK